MRRSYLCEQQDGPLGGTRYFNGHDTESDARADLAEYVKTYQRWGWSITGNANTCYIATKGQIQRTISIGHIDEDLDEDITIIEQFRPNVIP